MTVDNKKKIKLKIRYFEKYYIILISKQLLKIAYRKKNNSFFIVKINQ